MAITFPFENSATISTTEYSLTNNSTTIATRTDKAHVQALIDASALLAGDEYEIRVLDKLRSVDAQTDAIPPVRIIGAQSKWHVTPGLFLGNGWDVTVKKIAGTDRTIKWSIRQAA